jgi:excisionase family DNA binding protein
MRGLGAFQMAQMKHKDARVLVFYRHVRSAIDVLELIALDPYQPPEKPAPEPVAASAPPPPPPVIPQEKLTYSVKEASAALSLSKTTIWKAIADGVLPAQKFGNRTLIPAEGLRAWLAAMPSARKQRRPKG